MLLWASEKELVEEVMASTLHLGTDLHSDLEPLLTLSSCV